MKKRKLSNKTKGKILIGIPTLIIVGVLSVVLFSRFDFDYFWNEFLKKTVDNAIGKGSHSVILSLIACPIIFLSMIAIIDHVIPVLCFFIGKPLKYFTIWRLCLKNGYSCHFRRAPFVSLRGVEECADVEIQMDEKKLFVHFIDVPFPVLRMFLLVNDREYRMHRSLPGKLIQVGRRARAGSREMDHNNYNEYSIPEFPPKGTEYHYLVIDPSYATSFFMSYSAMCDITGECVSGNVTVCRWRSLQRRLKSNFYAPLK